MQELQLYIEGVRVDLFKDESVSLTQTIQNVKDPAKIFTSFTKTFSLPASKTNNKLFEHYYNFNIQNGFDARIKKVGQIELNHIPFKTGRVKLEGVDLKSNLAHTYRITFFGNTVELPDIIGDDKLGQLGFGSPSYNLTYQSATIQQRLRASVDGGKIIVPLITHTQRLFYNSGTSSAQNGNLYPNTAFQQGVEFDQLKYAIRLYEIILEIESRYSVAEGFPQPIVFSRDFFNTNNPVFYNLYMWLHRKSGSVQAPTQVTSYTTTTCCWQNTANPPFVIALSGNVIMRSDTLTQPSNIFFNKLIVTPVSGNTVQYQVQVLLGGSPILLTSATAGVTTITDLNGTALVPNGVYSVAIIHPSSMSFTGVTWEFDGFYRPPGQQAPTSWNETCTLSQFTATAAFDFVVSQQIPDVSVMSFLTGLFKMFNLVAYVDDSGTIVVRPLEGAAGVDYSYYTSDDISGNDAPVNYDISRYVDVTKRAVNVALPYKEIIYQYEGTGTILAKQHAQLSGSPWGTLKYIGGENTSGSGGVNYNASTKLYQVKVPFEHMKFERLINVANSSNTTVQWGWSVNENQQPYIGKPLIFYATLQSGGNPISYQTVSGRTTVQTYWVPSNSLYLDASTGTQNINFTQELNEYDVSGTFDETLFAQYHSQYIIDVFNQRRRITKLTAFLPLKILFNFKLNDVFTINSQEYLINSVTTNLQSGKSDMELLNKVKSQYNTITVLFNSVSTILYYRSSIGVVRNLSAGDVMYSNKELTSFPTSGTYTQVGVTNDQTKFCDLGSIMVMVLGSNGNITLLSCAQQP